MSKNIGFKCSVLQNDKSIVAGSNCNWSNIRPGSYVKISNNIHIYEINKVINTIYKSEFSVINSKRIILDKNANKYLLNNDQIKIYYQQYEFLALINIINGGRKYKENDILYINGGIPSININTGEEEKTKFIVRSVDEKGKILLLAIEQTGLYIKPPENKVYLNGGHGEACEIEVQFVLQNDRSFIERNIYFIERHHDNKIILILDYPLPHGLNKGIIYTTKWEILLVNEYLGENNFDSICEIINDFTPNIKLPLILPNSIAKESLTNKSLTIIDNEISNLKKEIEELKKLLNRT